MAYVLADGNPSQWNFDLGLGSKLFAWAQAYDLSKIRDDIVVIPSDEWVEHLFLDLPNTECWDRYDILSYNWIDIQSCDNQSELLNSGDNWLITSVSSVTKDDRNYDPLLNIRFKQDELNRFIQSYSWDWGLHLRRWGGVRVEKDQIMEVLNTLPNKTIKAQYYEMMLRAGYISPKQNPDDSSWIVDDEYFKCLDYIVKNNPSTQIYLSTDVPDHLIQYYFDKYPNIVPKKPLIDEWLDLVSNYYSLDKVLGITNPEAEMDLRHSLPEWQITTVRDVAIDLLDLFMLSRSESYLFSESAQWGDCAYRISPTNLIGTKCNSHRIGENQFYELHKMVVGRIETDTEEYYAYMDNLVDSFDLNELI